METVSTFTKSPLKFGGGHVDWKRFFALAGSALAMREGTPLVEGTPSDPKELVTELKFLASKLQVEKRLRGWTTAIKEFGKKVKLGPRDTWVLLILDVSKNTLKARGFSSSKKASEAVAEIEASPEAGHTDAVIVWVNSMNELRKAYPNYYADTSAFLEVLNVMLSGGIKPR